MKVSIIGVVFVSILFLTSITGSIIFTPITTFLALLERKLRGTALFRESSVVVPFLNRWNNLIQGTWFQFVDILLETLYDIHLHYTLVGSPSTNVTSGTQISEFLAPPRTGKFNILILNHRTRIDWMLAWILLSRTQCLFSLKIVLKESLMRAPFFGWAMQTFRFLFLSRKWEQDEQRIQKVIAYAKRSGDSSTYLIFPEGSDLSPSNVEKSNAFAKEKGLPMYRHVLNPRTTGIAAIKNMIGAENIDTIYDITMGYTDFKQGQRPGEEHLLNGEMPKAIHFVVSAHRFGPTDVPSDDGSFKQWVEDRFAKKELLLSKFYSANPVGFTKAMITEAYGDSKIGLTSAGTPIRRRPFADRAKDVLAAVSAVPFVTSLALWVLPTLYLWLWKVFVSTSWCLLGYTVLVIAGYVYVTKTFGGVDRMMLY